MDRPPDPRHEPGRCRTLPHREFVEITRAKDLCLLRHSETGEEVFLDAHEDTELLFEENGMAFVVNNGKSEWCNSIFQYSLWETTSRDPVRRFVARKWSDSDLELLWLEDVQKQKSALFPRVEDNSWGCHGSTRPYV